MRWWSAIIAAVVVPLLFPWIKGLYGFAISPSEPILNPVIPAFPDKQDVAALVATLDGTVYLVEAMEVRWSLSLGSPIYSSYQAASVSSDHDRQNASELGNDYYYLDCGDDWELYVHSKRLGKPQKLPLSAEEYIRRMPHKRDNGETTLGLKKSTVFIVDAMTGDVINSLGLDNFPSASGVQGLGSNGIMPVKEPKGLGPGNLGEARHLIHVTRTDYVLQHYSNSSEVLWNVAFANIEAEFQCSEIQSPIGGFDSSATYGSVEKDWHLPCQRSVPVLRIRDCKSLEFDKLAISRLGYTSRFLPASDVGAQAAPFLPALDFGGGADLLPVPVHEDGLDILPAAEAFLPVGHVQRAPPALPTSAENSMAYLPLLVEPSAHNIGGTLPSSLHSRIVENPLLWATSTAVLIGGLIFLLKRIGGFIWYYLSAAGKKGKSSEEVKPQAVLPKKKKNRKPGNKTSPFSEKRLNNVSPDNVVRYGNDTLIPEVNSRKMFLNFSNLVDGPVDSRRIGKLLVSNKEIAKGSNGTVVLEGIYDGRAVAVKRLVQTHYDVALKEIQNLIASDHHPNIVRWYGVEHDLDFVYIALELCTCSLDDFVYVYSNSFESRAISKCSNLDQNIKLWKPNGYPSAQLLKLMRDVVCGLAHLHELGIIHRDLKPPNVLILNDKSFCAKLSDMGISKRLVGDVSSLTQHVTGSGSSGWQAPEQLLQGRQTRAIDLFSLGCVLYFCMTGGKHPFGDNIERDLNIVNNKKDLFLIENIPEAVDLLSSLLDPDPDKRPKAREVLNHPLFWSPDKRLSFLQNASDRVELEDRENRSEILDALESCAPVALNGKWDEKMESIFISNIGRYRRYKYDSVRDLLRVIRNKSHHYRELPQEIKDLLGSHPDGFEAYFSHRFPRLLIEVYNVLCQHCKEEEFFRRYVESDVF